MNSLLAFFNNLTVGKKILLLLAPIITVLTSMKEALLGLCILIFIDLLTGIRKNHYKAGIRFNLFKREFWTSIKSYLLRQTWKKTYEYGFGILVIVVFESLIFGKSDITIFDKVFTLSELLVVIPSIVELWSIFENFEAVSGNNILKKVKLILPFELRKIFSAAKGEKEENDEDTSFQI